MNKHVHVYTSDIQTVVQIKFNYMILETSNTVKIENDVEKNLVYWTILLSPITFEEK